MGALFDGVVILGLCGIFVWGLSCFSDPMDTGSDSADELDDMGYHRQANLVRKQEKERQEDEAEALRERQR